MSDGGEVTLDWKCPEASNESTPICLFLPGVTGCSQVDYIRSLVTLTVEKLAYKCVVFNYRGRGGHPLKTPKLYCVTQTEDLACVIEHIKDLHPKSLLMATAVSFGGALLQNYAADRNEHAKKFLAGAMLISPTYDPMASEASLRQPGLNSVIGKYITDCLIDTVKIEEHQFKALDLHKIYSSKTISEFAEAFNCPAFGMRDYADFAQRSMFVEKLDKVAIPMLALSAEDDIFAPWKSIPIAEVKRSEFVAILTTKRGGHMAFIEGLWPSPHDSFSNRVFLQFARSIMNK